MSPPSLLSNKNVHTKAQLPIRTSAALTPAGTPGSPITEGPDTKECIRQCLYILFADTLTLTGKIILWLSEIALFSVFPDTVTYENTKNLIFICHQFGIYTTFAIHMTKVYDSKARNLVVIKYQLL